MELCFFLAGRSMGKGFPDLLKEGGMQAIPIPIFWVQSIQVNTGIAYWLALTLVSLQAFLAPGTCQFGWPWQVTLSSLKNWDHTSHTPHLGNGVQPYCIRSTFL